MAKLKFEKIGDERVAEVSDEQGDHLTVSINAGIPDNYFLVIDVNGEMVGLEHKQAVALALGILKEATR